MGARRILLVDDDETVPRLVEEVLRQDGHDVVYASRPSEALRQAAGGRFDLFLLDVNLPEMDGFALRDELRRQKVHAQTPVVFLSGATAEDEILIAQKLGHDKLLLKPIPKADLLRTAQAAMGMIRVDSGTLPDSLDRILAQVASDGETGILTAVQGQKVKRVVFREGTVAFAASNDPRETIGQAFVRAGLVTEKDLSAAFTYRAGHDAAEPLGAILTALRKVTPEQCQRVFEKKVRESVLELFLWRAGQVEYAAGGVVQPERPIPLAIDLEPICAEGIMRRFRWLEVQRLLPDPTARFEVVGGSWPTGFPKNEGDRVLARHVEAGRSIEEILIELRGQDFAVMTRLAGLVKARALKVVANTGFSGKEVKEAPSLDLDIDDALATMFGDSPDPSTSAPPAISQAPAPPAESARRPPPAPPMPMPAPDDDEDEGLVIHETAEPPPSSPMTSGPSVHRAPAAPRREGRSAPPAVPTLSPPTDTDPFGLGKIAAELESLAAAAAPEPPPPEESSIVPLLTRALVLFRAGDLAGARAGLLSALEVDPMNPLARQRLAEVDEAMASESATAGLAPGTKVRLAIPIQKLVGKKIPANDAFLLTRLATREMTISELTQICPIPEREIHEALKRHLDAGVIAKVD